MGVVKGKRPDMIAVPEGDARTVTSATGQ